MENMLESVQSKEKNTSLEPQWMELIELAMKSNVTKEEFKIFLESKRQKDVMVE